jgi:hypothetical protein
MLLHYGREILIEYDAPVTPRHIYAAETLFGERLGLVPRWVMPGAVPADDQTPRLCYGTPPPGNSTPSIPCAGLLSETGNGLPSPLPTSPDGYPVLFEAAALNAIIPFDILSALFWLLTRYEEYQPFDPDKHGRFHAEASLLGRHGLLETPLAEVWLRKLSENIKSRFPGIPITMPAYRFLPTIDIDSPWGYRHKPLLRTAGGIIKTIVMGRFPELKRRLMVLAKMRKDPFDTFDTLHGIHRGKESPLFFFLLGTYNRFNKNPSPGNRAYRKLILTMQQQGNIGIHPSYETSDNPAALMKEVSALQEITGSKIIRSRSHFLRFRLPHTYRELIRAGITEEYSMGFADQPGFRAGTALPFRFYDLDREEASSLTVFPVTLMDGTLRDYLGLDTSAATERITRLAHIVRKNHGTFITLWHNESLDGSGRWTGWTGVYRHLIACASDGEDNTPPSETITTENHDE